MPGYSGNLRLTKRKPIHSIKIKTLISKFLRKERGNLFAKWKVRVGGV